MKTKVSALVVGCTVIMSPVYGESLDLSLPNADLFATDYDPSYSYNPTQWYSATETPALPLETEQTFSFRKDNEEFEESWLTGSKAHKYMGLGALGLVALAAISPKEEGGMHEYFATSATVLAAGAATTGFIYHWDDFDFSDGFTDPDNLHMMLGLLGTLAMVAAISEAPEAGHSGPGILGGVAMGVAIKITW